jgi:hypothetical protein
MYCIDAPQRIVTKSLYRVEIFKQSMGARNRVVIGLSYRPARLHRLAEFIPWNRFLGSIIVYKNGLRTAPPFSILNGHLSCSVLTAQDSPKKAAVDLTWLLQSTTGITPSEIILGVTQTVIRGNVVLRDLGLRESISRLVWSNPLTGN